MFGLLKKYLGINTGLNGQQLDEVFSLFNYREAKRGSILLHHGDACENLYFVNKGCMRVYYLSAQGQQRTRFFAFEGAIGAALASFISGEPSLEMIDLQEDSELLYIKRDDFYHLVASMPVWKDFYCKLLEFGYIHNQQKMESLLNLDARQRYELLMTQSPELFQRISNRVLATYIDISPETLSRLKSPQTILT